MISEVISIMSDSRPKYVLLCVVIGLGYMLLIFENFIYVRVSLSLACICGASIVDYLGGLDRVLRSLRTNQ